MILALSDRLSAIERVVLVALAGLIVVLIILNIATRASGWSLYWIDEAAVHTMVVLSFIAAAQMARARAEFSVTLLLDLLPSGGRRAFSILTTAIGLAFGVFLLVLAWRWFDPLTFARHGFDVEAFSRATFNFIYREQTNTLGIRKVWFYLVMPWFAGALIIHSAANLVEIAGAPAPQDGMVEANAVAG